MSAYKGDPDTDLHERLAALEALVDGGPGNTMACKRHEADLMQVKNDVQALKATIQKWAGVAVFVTFLIQLVLPIILSHFLKTKP